MNPEHFKISISSPPDRDCLVAEIFMDNNQWAEVNQESGELMLELYPRKDGQPWVFDFETALEVLQAAKKKLIGKE